jgi:hypothetical protein
MTILNLEHPTPKYNEPEKINISRIENPHVGSSVLRLATTEIKKVENDFKFTNRNNFPLCRGTT